MGCSPPGSTVHGDALGKNTGVGSIPSSKGFSQPRDQTQVSHIAGRFFATIIICEVPKNGVGKGGFQ